MINYLIKKVEQKKLEEKMKSFERDYIIKARGNQEFDVYKHFFLRCIFEYTQKKIADKTKYYLRK